MLFFYIMIHMIICILFCSNKFNKLIEIVLILYLITELYEEFYISKNFNESFIPQKVLFYIQFRK